MVLPLRYAWLFVQVHSADWKACFTPPVYLIFFFIIAGWGKALFRGYMMCIHFRLVLLKVIFVGVFFFVVSCSRSAVLVVATAKFNNYLFSVLCLFAFVFPYYCGIQVCVASVSGGLNFGGTIVAPT